MPKVTSAPAGVPRPRTIQFRSATDGHRVIYHEPICPDCGSFEVTETRSTRRRHQRNRPVLRRVRHRLAGRLRRGLGHPRTRGE